MTEEESMSDAAMPWTVELDCGHRIEVPVVAGSLATMACVTEHQQYCRRPVRVGLIDTAFGYPVAGPRGVVNR